MSFYVVAHPTKEDEIYNPGFGLVFLNSPYQTRDEAERKAQRFLTVRY